MPNGRRMPIADGMHPGRVCQPLQRNGTMRCQLDVQGVGYAASAYDDMRVLAWLSGQRSNSVR